MTILINKYFILTGKYPGKEAQLVAQTGFPTACSIDNPDVFYLSYENESLFLSKLINNQKLSICVNFASGKLNHRRSQGGGKQQAIARAIGLNKKNKLNILDATAGLGNDAFVLASLGCNVTMLERSLILNQLLIDGLNRAMQEAHLAEIISRLELHNIDAIEYMENSRREFDVVYLDPMFPERKKTSKVKKEMQILQQLHAEPEQEQQQENDEMFLQQAKATANYRVVIKRPAHAPYFANSPPSHQITGKSTRFDVYM